MSEVRRWAHTVEWEGLQISATYMAINDGGEYVMHDDYAALEAECDKLRAQVSALQSDANSWQSGYDKGREDGAKAADGWKAQHARDSAELRRLCAERDALHAEAEVLRVVLHEIASVNPAQRGIEWAKSYASDGLKGAGSELYARWLETFKEAEALRAENGRLQADRDRANQYANQQALECNKLSTDLEAARGLLESAVVLFACHCTDATAKNWHDAAAAFLTATPAPEVPDHIEQHIEMAEQGERQEAVAWALANSADEIGGFAPIYYTKEGAISWANGRNIFPLYTTPQPGPEVRRLVEAMNFACKSLCHVTSSDGSGHADIALSVLRMAGVDGEERERLVDGWKASCQWRIDKAHRQAQSQA